MRICIPNLLDREFDRAKQVRYLCKVFLHYNLRPCNLNFNEECYVTYSQKLHHQGFVSKPRLGVYTAERPVLSLLASCKTHHLSRFVVVYLI